jgi:hypothetical protein
MDFDAVFWPCYMCLIWGAAWFALASRNLLRGQIALAELFALVLFAALAMFSASLLGA